MVLRITKEFRFEMAHALLGHDGPCKDIHGHSYRLLITLKGQPQQTGEKKGMLFDFADLKKIVQETIIQPFDHALALHTDTPPELLHPLRDHNLIVLGFQPTCEQLCAHFACLLKGALPRSVSLHCVTLYETATSYAEWYAEDNLNAEI